MKMVWRNGLRRMYSFNTMRKVNGSIYYLVYNGLCIYSNWSIFVYCVVLTLLVIPLLGGQNSAGEILISVVGTMIVSIAAMIVYVVVIEPKYRKK